MSLSHSQEHNTDDTYLFNSSEVTGSDNIDKTIKSKSDALFNKCTNQKITLIKDQYVIHKYQIID